ncbi:integrating conjugative element protein [Thiomicrospira aerophila AL3]|uniref:Integrating conjugative element protein n=1 Tax=Thiomicrospira aerophila AL3 TaxID=717772 RepID=W0DX02_9GAMM|nr:integrating conjugative element protein [Thiomicrospira aerophila]AHF01396.1 integrating conjugative element protein [Thiomicrospira aerophila AL3]
MLKVINKSVIVSCFALGFGFNAAHAQLPVIAEVGPTYPVTSMFSHLHKFTKLDVREVFTQIDQAGVNRVTPVDYYTMVQNQLPINTHAQPGPFAQYESVMAARVDVPVCIVGDDGFSQAWLRQNAAKLIEYGAVCLIAHAQDMDGLKNIIQSASGVYIQPASASTLIDELEIKHYPALIYNGWVVQ